MKTVRVSMSDDQFEDFRARAKQAKLPGIASYLLQQAGALTDENSAADIVKEAIKAAKKRGPQDEFTLSDLFGRTSWAGFAKGARLRAGRQFANVVIEEGKTLGLKLGGKTGANHQTYIRTGG